MLTNLNPLHNRTPPHAHTRTHTHNRRRRPLGPSGGLPGRISGTGRPPIRLPRSGRGAVPPGGAAVPSDRRRRILRRRCSRCWVRGADAAAAVLRPAAWHAAAGVRAGGADVCRVSKCFFFFALLEKRRRRLKTKLTLFSLSRPHSVPPFSFLARIKQPTRLLQGPAERQRLPRAVPPDPVLLLPPQPLNREEGSRGAFESQLTR